VTRNKKKEKENGERQFCCFGFSVAAARSRISPAAAVEHHRPPFASLSLYFSSFWKVEKRKEKRERRKNESFSHTNFFFCGCGESTFKQRHTNCSQRPNPRTRRHFQGLFGEIAWG
jgi:hypothetical protein